MSRRIFSQILSPDNFCGKKCREKSSRKSSAKSSKCIYQKSPTHFCRGAGPTSPSVTFVVTIFAVCLGCSLCSKEEDFCCRRGVARSLYATHEQVSFSRGCRGRFPGNSPVLEKNPTEKLIVAPGTVEVFMTSSGCLEGAPPKKETVPLGVTKF